MTIYVSGDQGTGTVGMEYVGVWSSTTTYTANQVVSYNGFPYVSTSVHNVNSEPDLSPSSWAQLLSLSSGGDQVDAIAVEAPTKGQYVDLRSGTSTVPDTSLNPPMKVSRTVSYNSGGGPGYWQGVADANSAAIVGQTTGTTSNQAQIIGVLGTCKQFGTTQGQNAIGGLASPDAVGVEGYAFVQGASAVGAAIALVGIAHNTSPNGSGKQVTNALQLFVYNDTGTDSSVVTNQQALARGISIYSAGGNLGGCAIEVAAAVQAGAKQFDVGLHFVGNNPGNGYTGPVATAAIQDDSQAATSIQLNGTHTSGIVIQGTYASAAIAVGSSSGSIVVGALNPSGSALLDIRAANSTNRAVATFGNTANAQSYAVKVQTSEGQAEFGVGHTQILLGMAAGDTYLKPQAGSNANPFLHLGGSASVLKVGLGNTLSFFNVSDVAQQVAVGNTHTVSVGSGSSVFTNTTFDGSTGSTGYTVGDVVRALKNYGLLAS